MPSSIFLSGYILGIFLYVVSQLEKQDEEDVDL